MTRDLTTTEACALETIAYFGKHRTEGEPVDASTLTVGQIVRVHSRGGWRNAVVEKIGPKRVGIVYTTDGAIAEAQARFDGIAPAVTDAKIAERIASATALADRNFDFYVGEVDERTRKYGPYSPDRLADMAAAVAAGREATREAHIAETMASVAEARAALAAGREAYVRNRINFTRKSVSVADVLTA